MTLETSKVVTGVYQLGNEGTRYDLTIKDGNATIEYILDGQSFDIDIDTFIKMCKDVVQHYCSAEMDSDAAESVKRAVAKSEQDVYLGNMEKLAQRDHDEWLARQRAHDNLVAPAPDLMHWRSLGVNSHAEWLEKQDKVIAKLNRGPTLDETI